jgi:RNA polymerase sigma-70 factor (ECF subfamily)
MSPSLEQRLSDTSFERLYRRHRRDVYGAVLRDVRDPAEAEDVTQIAFLNAFRAMRRGERPDKPRAWLVTIARNVIRRRYRQLAARPQEIGLDPETVVDLSDAEGPTAGEIATAIRRLPPNQRAVILLREIQGRSYAEIAGELGLSLSAVETLIFRARRSLGEELELADHAPATQRRRSRGFFFIPIPGLGKLGSLGFSLSRAGVAALVGGVAIVAIPVGDPKADPLPPRTAVRPPPVTVQGPSLDKAPVAATAVKTRAKRTRHGAAKSAQDSGGANDTSGGVGGGLPAVDLPAADLPTADLPTADLPTADLPTADLPVVTEVPLPSLPVDPPALPAPSLPSLPPSPLP